MCRVITWELDNGIGAVSRARHGVAEALQQWALPDVVDDASLLTSELVTNAVQHGGEPVRVTVAVRAGSVEVAVSDSSRSLPQPREAGVTAEGGRGLALVDAVAAEWGIAAAASGKQVWFRLALDEGWPYTDGCPCSGARDATPLPSGQQVVRQTPRGIS